jgi:hypothetical protein
MVVLVQNIRGCNDCQVVLESTRQDGDEVKRGDELTTEYVQFLEQKSQYDGDSGFMPTIMPSYLFEFQAAVTEWAVRKGRAAIFADCGLGKTIMELVWAQNVSAHTGKPVLILTPLAVAQQFSQEADKFNIDAARSHRGEIDSPIVITNYERLHLFEPEQFGGVICDESSILKSFDGVRRKEITEFMRRSAYRLLATATAAPNDYTELGTSSEALGYLGYMDMLSRFFTNRRQSSHAYNGKWRLKHDEWRFKGHAEEPFWRWVASWARALRRPSDLGFADDGFVLPEPVFREHVVEARSVRPGMLFTVPAVGLDEEHEERRRTINERCEMVADLVNKTGQPAVVWCHLNPEGDLLERLIPDAIQVSGSDSDDAKEEKFVAFSSGNARVIVTKPKIGAWGLNWQHCAHLTFFPSHSYEQFYQAVRRCWRFGQKRPVEIDIVATEGEINVQHNMRHKADAADRMFASLVTHMQEGMTIRRIEPFTNTVEVPTWMRG